MNDILNNKVYLCNKNDILKKKYLNTWVEEWKDELIVFINKENKIKIFSSICPHFGGEIVFDEKMNELKCKWHDWRFCSETGTCKTYKIIGRLRNYDFKVEPGLLKNYGIEITNNKIYAILHTSE